MKSSYLLFVVALLISIGLVISNAYANGLDSELLEAAESGDVSRVVRALDQGASIEAKNDKGATALMFAAVGGHDAVVTLLIQRGANVNAKTATGATALKGAAAQGHPAVVRVLLQAGADATAKDNEGKTALDAARAEGQKEIVAVLEQAMPRTGSANGSSGGVEAVVIRVDQPEQCLRIRQGPDAGSEKVGCLPKGTKLKLTGTVQNNWAQMVYPMAGWITASQVKAPGLFPAKSATASERPRRASSGESTRKSNSSMDAKEREFNAEIESLKQDQQQSDDAAAQGGRMLRIGPLGIGIGGF